jgi:hypothetical protein
MQADYRSRVRSNVMTLTRTRARSPGNQIGVCSLRATASSPEVGIDDGVVISLRSGILVAVGAWRTSVKPHRSGSIKDYAS